MADQLHRLKTALAILRHRARDRRRRDSHGVPGPRRQARQQPDSCYVSPGLRGWARLLSAGRFVLKDWSRQRDAISRTHMRRYGYAFAPSILHRCTAARQRVRLQRFRSSDLSRFAADSGAGVAKLVNATGSHLVERKLLWVRLPPPAPPRLTPVGMAGIHSEQGANLRGHSPRRKPENINSPAFSVLPLLVHLR